MERHADERPAALDDLSATQMAELEREFDEANRANFDEHIRSYGLDGATGNVIWAWFAARDDRTAVRRAFDPAG